MITTTIRRKRDNRVLDTAQKGHPIFLQMQYFSSPAMWYDATGNRTYIAWGQRGESPYHRRGNISVYDHATKTIVATTQLPLPAAHYFIGTESDNWVDLHICPTVTMDDSGYIIIAIEENHNGEVRILKSNSPRAIGGFTELTGIFASTSGTFNGMGHQGFYKHQNFVCVSGREKYDHLCFVRSTDGGATYGSPFKVTDLGTGNQVNNRHYHVRPMQAVGVSNRASGNLTDPGFHAFVLRRDNLPSIHYSELYYLWSPPNLNMAAEWYNRPKCLLSGNNVASTFGRHVFNPATAPFTNAELNTNFRIKSNGGNSTLNISPFCSFVCPASNLPYIITPDQLTSNFCFHYLNPATNAWVENQFMLPNTDYANCRPMAMKAMSDDYIQVIARVVDGSQRRLILYVTTDKGLTWKMDRVLYTSPLMYGDANFIMNMTANVAANTKFMWSVAINYGAYSDLAFGEF